MPYHLVTYDIRTPKNNDEYEKMYATLKSFSDWAWVQDSVWIVEGASSRDVYLTVDRHLRSNDSLLVTELTNNLCSKNHKCQDWWLNSKFKCLSRAGGLLEGLSGFNMLTIAR